MAKTKQPRIKEISEEQRMKAEMNGEFIKAVGTGTLRLSGAAEYLQKHPKGMYNLDYRLFGTEAEIKAVLMASGIPEADINMSITSSIDSNNLAMMQDVLAAEEKVSADARARSKKEPAPLEFNLTDLDKIVRMIKGEGSVEPVVKKTKAPRSRSASPRGPRGPRESLQQRLNELKADEVIDVSKMKADGTGAKKTKAAGDGKAKKKVGVNGLKIVANNYSSYHQAVMMLEGGARFAEQYAAMYGKGAEANIPKAAASPKPRQTRAKSPNKTPLKPRTASPRGRSRSPSPPRAAAPRVATPPKVPSPPRKIPAPIKRSVAPVKGTPGVGLPPRGSVAPRTGALSSILGTRSPRQ